MKLKGAEVMLDVNKSADVVPPMADMRSSPANSKRHGDHSSRDCFGSCILKAGLSEQFGIAAARP